MTFSLRNRSFLSELDFAPGELRFLLRLAAGPGARCCSAYRCTGGSAGR